MDLALALYDDVEAIGVEHFFELARNACDLSVDRFDMFHNDFRSRSVIDPASFVQILNTYLTEKNLLDLMNTANAIHNRALRKDNNVSRNWIDLVESCFDQLDLGVSYFLDLNEVALLAAVIGRGEHATWQSAKRSAISLLDACNQKDAHPRLTKRTMKTALLRWGADDDGLREIERALKSINARWQEVGFGEQSITQLAVQRADPSGAHIPSNIRTDLSQFIAVSLASRDALLPDPAATNYAEAMYRHSLPLFLRFCKQALYSVPYKTPMDLLDDPVLSCICQALINHECIGYELVTLTKNVFADIDQHSHAFDHGSMTIDDVVKHARWILQ